MVGGSVIRRFQEEERAPVAWITPDETMPFPPDFATNGVDLERIVWFSPGELEPTLLTIDLLLRSEAFPLVCVDIPDPTSIPPGSFARFMHRLRSRGGTLLIVTSGSVDAPSPSIGFHINVQSSEPGEIAFRPRRVREPLADCTCHVDSPVPLS